MNGIEKASILAFTETGKKLKNISRMLSVGEATVVRWQKRYSKTSKNERKSGSGQPTNTTTAQNHRKVDA